MKSKLGAGIILSMLVAPVFADGQQITVTNLLHDYTKPALVSEQTETPVTIAVFSALDCSGTAWWTNPPLTVYPDPAATAILRAKGTNYIGCISITPAATDNGGQVAYPVTPLLQQNIVSNGTLTIGQATAPTYASDGMTITAPGTIQVKFQAGATKPKK